MGRVKRDHRRGVTFAVLPERVGVSHESGQVYGGDVAAVRVVQVGAARVHRVQALVRRADVHGPAEQPVQLALIGWRMHAARVELVELHLLHELQPSVARAHRVHQVAPDRVLPYDDGQLDLLQAVGRGGVCDRGRVRQALDEQELLDVGPPVVVAAAAAAARPVPEAVPPVLERRLRRRRGAAVPVVHVQADRPVQRHGRGDRGHL